LSVSGWLQLHKLCKPSERNFVKQPEFWSSQDMVYDLKSDITGIGNRNLTSSDDTTAL